jgi:hypothetical protein
LLSEWTTSGDQSREIHQHSSGRRLGPHQQAFVHDNPSIEKLIAALYSGVQVKVHNEFDDDDEGEKAIWSFMEDIYQKEIAHLIEKDGIITPRRYSLKSPFGRPTSSPIYPPDGGVAAWLQFFGSFLINMNSWGLVNTFGIYQAFSQSTLPASHSASISPGLEHFKTLFSYL